MLTEGTQLIPNPEPPGGATLITRDQRVLRLNRTGAACATTWQQPCAKPVEEAVRALTERHPQQPAAELEASVRQFLNVLQQAGALPVTPGEAVA